MRIVKVATSCVALIAAGGLALGACSAENRAPATANEPQQGGRLVATFRSEPTTYNRFVSARTADDLFMRLTQATLIRLNRVSGELEPWLASSWTSASPDGRVWTLKLRPGVVFSDGVPFTSADVEFTFQVLYDKKLESSLASSVLVADRPLDVRAVDDSTITLTMAAPYGPGLSLLDAIPILPRHKLEAAFKAGTFRDAWGLSTAPSDLAGLGPFVLKSNTPGERLVFARNPHYWRRDERGTVLPRLDELEVQVVPEQNAELLRLQTGTSDLMTAEVRPEDIAPLRKLEASGAVQLAQAGLSVNPEGLWFNLTPGAGAAKDRSWLQREELRRAISYGVDRKAFADAVFLGAAEPIYGPITPGNREWFLSDVPKTEYDPARAKALLESIGLKDHNGDGVLEDKPGRAAHFSILTQKGLTILEHSVAVLSEQLGKIGLTVEAAPLEQGAMIERFTRGQYDAMYFHILADSFDPARNPDFWMSSGDFHMWQPAQKTPAHPWEATIDDLMRRQSTTMDRAEAKRLFAETQKTFAEHLPMIYFATPQVTIAMSSRVHGATPSVLQPQVLWNPDVLWVTPAPKRQ